MKTKSNSISQIQKGEEDLSYNDNELNDLLGLDGENEFAVYAAHTGIMKQG